ncbi:MAG TPA: prepilin peptidase [Rhodospirillaceae bacterium]|nr:prepilin peptidase [Rhodospirillaceae bacterium]
MAIGAVFVVVSALIWAPDRLWSGCGLGWTLLLLAIIDLEDGVLPDRLTLPLLVAGLVWGELADGGDLARHIAGAALGGGLLAVPAMGYRRLRRRDGMGWGDVKLAAAVGAWLGWEAMPAMIVVAALTTIAAVLLRRRICATSLDAAIPFGPALAAATWLLWLSGPRNSIFLDSLMP